MLQLDIHHQFDGFALDVAFKAPAGVTALFGPSGAGKTTIIQAVAGLLTPQSGQISFGERALWQSGTAINLPARARNFGYVFQDARLFPHLTVRQNLHFGRRAKKRAHNPQLEEQIVSLLGIEALLDRKPSVLSGGEKQRVALGRAVLSEPEMLLLDEPLAAIDAPRRNEILGFLESLRDEFHLPMLYVSHSVSEVARLANSVALIREGRLTAIGSVSEIFSSTEHAHTLGLREAGAVLLASVKAHHDDGLCEIKAAGGNLFLPDISASVGDIVRLRVRANDVMLATERPRDISALNILQGKIAEIKSGDGPGALVKIACGKDHLLSRITKRSLNALNLQNGMPVFAVLKSVSVARADISGQ